MDVNNLLPKDLGTAVTRGKNGRMTSSAGQIGIFGKHSKISVNGKAVSQKPRKSEEESLQPGY